MTYIIELVNLTNDKLIMTTQHLTQSDIRTALIVHEISVDALGVQIEEIE